MLLDDNDNDTYTYNVAYLDVTVNDTVMHYSVPLLLPTYLLHIRCAHDNDNDIDLPSIHCYLLPPLPPTSCFLQCSIHCFLPSPSSIPTPTHSYDLYLNAYRPSVSYAIYRLSFYLHCCYPSMPSHLGIHLDALSCCSLCCLPH